MRYAYCILHTGKPYLRAAVEAILPQVDKVYIFYAQNPSQGHSSNIPCPDTRDDLLNEVKGLDVEWVDGSWQYEGEHNDEILKYVQNDDWIVRFDSDEIYPDGSVEYFIKNAEESNCNQYRMPFLHFWRSFDWVCKDGQWPIRLTRKRGDGLGWLPDKYRVFHMGYAIPTNYIEYKMQVSGHRNEWRPIWFSQKWLPNAKQDIHPVSYLPVPLWNAEPFLKETMPEVLKRHEYYNKVVIE